MAIVKRAETVDGIAVYVTSEGELCDGAGRTFGRIKLPMSAAIMVANEIELALAAEVATLVKAAARLLRSGRLLPGNLRAAAFTAEYREPHTWCDGWLTPLRA